MNVSRIYLTIIAMIFLCSFTAYAAYTKEETVRKSAKSHDHGVWEEKRFVATIDADGIQRVEMVGGDYYFDPNYIVVKVNKPVELKIKKAAGYIPHNFIAKSPEAGIDFNISLKTDPQTVKFTPLKVGKYPIYCNKSILWFKTHRQKGMEGMIEVVE